jgi:hypothetical protein
LLSFIDHFTRFCEAIPIAIQDAETIAREFVIRIITQFGVPKKFLTDRGANFTSALMKEMCRPFKIQKLQTSSYHPQANGVCERMHKLLVDMLSHFVRKDARNLDEYVPYAIMAYRAMPHCSTKYSPYYLVFGQDMRLQIEDNWKPQKKGKEIVENDYEEHMKTLAKRLHEANRIAGQQSKLTHEVSKRYYDRQAKWQYYSKGDLVYIHDPTHKRGKARKFSYQYKGPFEIEKRISPLIYKVRLTNRTFTIVHINRLKGAYEPKRTSSVSPQSKEIGKQMKQRKLRKSAPQERKHMEDAMLNVEIPPTLQILEEVNEGLSDSDSDKDENRIPKERREDSEWVPGSSYLCRKLQGNETTDDNVYKLCSRLVSRSRQEMVNDKTGAEANSLPGSEQLIVSVSENISPGRKKGHSYNLRGKIGAASSEVRKW